MDLRLIQGKRERNIGRWTSVVSRHVLWAGAWQRTRIQKVSAAKLPVHLTDYNWPEVTASIQSLASENTTD